MAPDQIEITRAVAPNPPAMRRPLLIAAWLQLGVGSLLLIFAGPSLRPTTGIHQLLLGVAIVLLLLSGAAVLRRKSWSWFPAVGLQAPLMAYCVWITTVATQYLVRYNPADDPHGVGPVLTVLMMIIVIPLGFASLTIIAFLLRPRTKALYGLQPHRMEWGIRARWTLAVATGALFALGCLLYRVALGSLMWDALWSSDVQMMTRLLDAGAPADARDPQNGWTPLIAAAFNGMGDQARLLSERGADVNARDASGGTALTGAVENHHAGVAALLLARGADPNLRDESNITALTSAAGQGNAALVKLLLEAGADPNPEGRSPLGAACERKHLQVVEILLRSGADPTATDSSGKSSIDHARETGHSRILALLRAATVKPSLNQR